MITPPTTFVVGAGASRAYGLPVASAVCKAAKGLIAGNDVYQLLYCILKDTAILDRVLDDLRKYGGPDSIDAWLAGSHQAAHFASAARNVAFITFNFDSVIEERSVQVIRSIYNGVVAVRDRVASVLETAH
jgi:hypothetical protein